MSTSKEQPADINQGRKRALIICISDYDNKLESLAFCKNDGEKMYELLQSLGYEIPDNHRLLGRVNHEAMKNAIKDFFMREVRSKDTLLFYFSGHGIPEDNGVHYLATSELDPEEPYDKGYSFEELERMMDRSVSTRKVIMLDCCYSGAARPGGKGGNEEEAATLGREAINKTIKAGEGKCVLASSLSYQKSYASKEQEHSIFTYYLMDGLKGNKESVNSNGTITPDTLGRYVFDRVTEKLPKQKPIRKVEASGDIILAYYPHLAKRELERVNASSSLSPSASAEIYWKMEEIDEYERNEDYDSAIPCYQEAIAIDPHNYRLHNRMGKAYFNLGRDQDAIAAYQRAISARPEHPDAYDLKGDVYFKLNDYKKALECYDKAWKIRPKSFEFLKDKGLAHYSLKEYEQAVEYLGKALEIKPEQNKIKEVREKALLKLQEVNELEKGISLYKSGKHDEALEAFKRSLEANSKNVQTLYYKGLVLAHQSQFDKGISCYEEALTINPKYDEALKAKEAAIEERKQKEISLLIQEGLRYDKKSDYQNAIDSFDEAIRLDPGGYVPYYEKGNVQSKLEEYDKALECYNKALEIQPKHYHAWCNKGEVLSKKGDDITSVESSKAIEYFNEAKRCYDEALRLQNNAEAWYSKGSTLKKINKISKLESRDEEIECFDIALGIKPNYAEAYYGKGQALVDLGKYKEAIKCFGKAIDIQPSYDDALKAKEAAEFKIAEAHYMQGQALSDSMKYEEAMESFNKALKIRPKYDKALKAKEAAHEKQKEKETSLILDEGLKYLEKGDYENANASFDKAVVLNPENYIAYSHKGDIQFKLGDYKKAIECYDKALKIKPKYYDVLKDKGLALHKLEEYKQAIACFDEALMIKPNQSMILEYRKQALLKLEETDTDLERYLNEGVELEVGQDIRTEAKISEKTRYKKAIIIGINKYESDSQIPTLAGAENDAQEIGERLGNNGNFEISPNHLLLGPNATRKNILKAISEIFRKENFKCDLVTFYFAGHCLIDENRVAYIAPYDMDPDDPHVSGINMEDLRKVISTTKNDASVIMFLDCCLAGIAAKDATRQYAIMDSSETRNLYANQLKSIIEPLNQSPSLQVGRGKIIFASSEADEAAREIKGCRHFGRDDPHPHGAFSFHLIEGLDGKAADPDTGVITIGSIKKHIEEQMRNEGKQIPVYHIEDASRIDSIALAISQQQYNAKISEIIKSAEEFIAARNGVLQLPDIQYLAEAAKQVGDLTSLDPNNSKIPILRRSIEDGINSYFEPAINWFNTNKRFARLKINEIETGLFDQRLQEIILGLNFDDLQKMDLYKLDILIVLCYEIANNTEFTSPDDPKLRIFKAKIHATVRRGSRV